MPHDVDGWPCVSHADAIEQLEALARDFFVALEEAGFEERAIEPLLTRACSGTRTPRSRECLRFACRTLMPALEQVTDEIAHVLDALAGPLRSTGTGRRADPRHGAHPADRPEFLSRSIRERCPSQAAWRVGEQLAREVLARHLAEEGRYPR